jgi:hypothetical protein
MASTGPNGKEDCGCPSEETVVKTKGYLMTDADNFPRSLHLTAAQRAALTAELDAVSVGPLEDRPVLAEVSAGAELSGAADRMNGFLLGHDPLVGGNSVGNAPILLGGILLQAGEDEIDEDIVTEMVKRKYARALNNMKRLIAALAGKTVQKTTCKDCMDNILGVGVGSPGNTFCAEMLRISPGIIGCIASMKANQRRVCEALFPGTQCD